jgi:DNA-binding MarR family transcriptional regulator
MTDNELHRDQLVADTLRSLQNLIWHGRQRLQIIVRDYGLTAPQASFLLHVHRHGPQLTMGQITDALQFTASTTTSIADRLVERRLISRGINPEDRRVVVVSLTPEGQEIVDKINDRRSRSFTNLLSQFSDDEVSTFRDTVEHIIEAMETDDP